jgi:hypothetical protein
MCVGFVGGIHEDETRGALRVIGREYTDVETCDGGPTSTTGPAIPLRSRSLASSLAMRRAVRGDGPGSL